MILISFRCFCLLLSTVSAGFFWNTSEYFIHFMQSIKHLLFLGYQFIFFLPLKVHIIFLHIPLIFPWYGNLVLSFLNYRNSEKWTVLPLELVFSLFSWSSQHHMRPCRSFPDYATHITLMGNVKFWYFLTFLCVMSFMLTPSFILIFICWVCCVAFIFVY